MKLAQLTMIDSTPSLRRQATRRARDLALCGALLALSGCGRPPEPGPFDGAPLYNGTVTILNLSNELHNVSIQALGGFWYECDAIAQNPKAFLNLELFRDSPTLRYTVPLFSGEELSVNPAEWTNTQTQWDPGGGTDRGPANMLCPAFLVQSSALPDIFVFYQADFMEFKQYYHNADMPKGLEPASQTIVIEADYDQVEERDTLHSWREHTCPNLEEREWWEDPLAEWSLCQGLSQQEQVEAARRPLGARYSWRSVNRDVPLFYQDSVADEGEPLAVPARCQVPGPGEGVEWETPPSGTFAMTGLSLGADGCHTLSLSTEGGIEIPWTMCAPDEVAEALAAFSEATRVTIEEQSVWQGARNLVLTLRDHPVVESIELLRVTEEESRLVTGSLPAWRVEPRGNCAPQRERCGEVSLPSDLFLGEQLVVAGEAVSLGEDETFYLSRLSYTPLVNASCEERENMFESSWVKVHIEGALMRSRAPSE